MSAARIVALAGGVGAARFLRGLALVVDPGEICVVVNTGDDREFYGLSVSPDLDIVTYTLAGAEQPDRGYGLKDDTFGAVERLKVLGHDAWFRLGDRDLANSLHRTLRLRAGAGLAAVADELRSGYGVQSRILPMSEAPCPTLVLREAAETCHFEEYLVRDGAPDDVRGVDLSAARNAKPGPGVIEALRSAQAVLVCPSNPVVSIGPILAVPGIREAIRASGVPVVAITPIVGGAPIKGPADRLLRGTGVEVSARGVAGMYRGVARGFVLDSQDAEQAEDIEQLGLRVCVTDTIMTDPQAAARLAAVALELAERLA